MKKMFVVCMLTFTALSSSQANQHRDYENALDQWEQSYPIIKVLRTEPTFKNTSDELLRSSSNSHISPQETFEKVVDKLISGYIRSGNLILVEGLDPVYRDLKNMKGHDLILPVMGENPYAVKNIFTHKNKS